MSARIRRARRDEHAAIRDLEAAADKRFEALGIGPFVDDGVDHLGTADLLLVAGEPPVAFIAVEQVGGDAHIWQLSVHPDLGRQGIGAALVEAAVAWAAANGFEALTLTTFRDVAWNAPFYSSFGFEPIDDLGPELAAIREHECAIGDDDFGPRVAMRLRLAK